MNAILGTVQLGLDYGINSPGKPSRKVALEILSKAYELGLRYLDTAAGYGDALEVIGEYHENFPEKKFNVYSKFSLNDTNSVEQEFDRQRQILRIDEIDGFYFHKYSDFVLHRANIDKVRKIIRLGVSIYERDELTDVLADETIQIIQVPFGILQHHSLLGKVLRGSGVSKEINLRSIFLQGVLFRSPEELPEVLQELRPSLEYLHNLSEQLGLTLYEMALDYVQSLTQVSGLIFGVDSADQLTSLGNVTTSFYDWQYLLKDMPVSPEKILDPRNWK